MLLQARPCLLAWGYGGGTKSGRFSLQRMRGEKTGNTELAEIMYQAVRVG